MTWYPDPAPDRPVPTTRGDDEVTLGEIARRLDRFAAEIQASISRTVTKEVYERDIEEIERRLDTHDRSLAALAANRRQMIYSAMAVVGATAAAAIGALVGGAHL